MLGHFLHTNQWRPLRDQLHELYKDSIVKTFWKVGLSLPIDGSSDHELAIRDLPNIEVGDWRSDEDKIWDDLLDYSGNDFDEDTNNIQPKEQEVLEATLGFELPTPAATGDDDDPEGLLDDPLVNQPGEIDTEAMFDFGQFFDDIKGLHLTE